MYKILTVDFMLVYVEQWFTLSFSAQIQEDIFQLFSTGNYVTLYKIIFRISCHTRASWDVLWCCDIHLQINPHSTFLFIPQLFRLVITIRNKTICKYCGERFALRVKKIKKQHGFTDSFASLELRITYYSYWNVIFGGWQQL